MDSPVDAYQRTRRYLSGDSGNLLLVRLLAALEGLLGIVLMVVGGLLVALLVSGGVTHVPTQRAAEAPPWLAARIAQQGGAETRDLWLRNTGLTPVFEDNTDPGSPALHRGVARALGGLVARFPVLQANRSAVLTLLAIVLAILLLVLLISQVRQRMETRLAVGAASILRRQIHRQLYRLGQSALPNQGVGPVLNLFTREVNDVRDGLLKDMDAGLRLPLLTAGALLFAAFVSLPWTLFLLALIGLLLTLYRPLREAAQARSARAAREAALQLCLIHEDLGLVRTVRVFGAEGFDKDRFDDHLEQFETADIRRIHTEQSVAPTLRLLIGAGLALAAGVAGLTVLGPNQERLSLAGVLVVAALIYLAYSLAFVWRDRRSAIRSARRSAETIFEYLDRKPELTMNVGARFLPPMSDRIAFENVSLLDPNGQPLLTAASTEIRAGTRTAVLSLDETPAQGLVCLIPRLIDPASGRVRIDGVDLQDVTLESLRAQVATVLQVDLIFSDTVLANIGLGDRSFTLPRIMQAAKVAHAHHFIQSLPQGYDTVIGPLGHYLSPDEQYRIGLARAFLHDPAILIIEEPRAAIDDEIKPLIDDTIDRLSKGRTLIFLPRRLSTLRRCDQVILIHDGRIEAVGPPRQLARDHKLYKQIQYMAFQRVSAAEVEFATGEA